MIIPPEEYPFGTPMRVIVNAAGDRPPLAGVVRVIVVLVDFSDQKFAATNTPAHFDELSSRRESCRPRVCGSISAM